MEKEVWKPVFNNEDRYKVSSHGRIKSLNYKRSGKEAVMVLPLNSRGYPIVKISRPNEKAKTRTVHQLVAEAFLNHRACGHDLIVDHIDGNRKNNMLSNLRLITQRKNLSTKKPASGFTGVTKQGNRWKAAAYLDGKVRHIGMYSTALEGHQAYLKFLGLGEVPPNIYNDKVLRYKCNHMLF
jgi:hypothetical protein